MTTAVAVESGHRHDRHTAGAGQGPAAVELGAGFGAIVLWTSAQLAGLELDISPEDEPDHRHHVAVLARQLPGGPRYAALYPALPVGRHRIWDPSGTSWMAVQVLEAAVVEVTWDPGATIRG